MSYRLLPVLFILSIAFLGVTGGKNLALASLSSISENQEEIPCEDDSTSSNNNEKDTTVTTTPTVPKTTTKRPCANVDAPVTPFRRKNGYWCSLVRSFYSFC